MLSVLTFAAAAGAALAINNGLGQTPAMGYSSWNDCSSFRDNGPNGWCWDSEAHIKNVTLYMISSGLAKLGYTQINVDEGWLKGRNAAGQMYEDLDKFPSGMKALGDFIKSQPTYAGSGDMMRYGLYSCRGTCQCGTGTYGAPGSNGHEADDTEFMVAAGAQYLKIDSCCGSQDHAVAFSDYGKWRDAMNASGTKHGWDVWFSLCGWETWYSPPDPALNYTGGSSLGNSWRIAGDGSGWGPLTNCMNTQAAAAPFAGPGGWPDPDLLIGPKVYVGGQTDEQARAQFTMWSLFPTNLLISQNVLQWSDYALETYSNAELIAINQDPLGRAARRISGGDLPFPCHAGGGGSGALASVVAAPCDASDPHQLWAYDAASGAISSKAFAGGVLDDGCSTTAGSPVGVRKASGGDACQGAGQKWTWGADGTVKSGNGGMCLDIYDWTGPVVDVWDCNGGTNQNFTLSADGHISDRAGAQPNQPAMCLTASVQPPQECSNVWGRLLAGGDFALGFVNNDVDSPSTAITCDATCFAALLNGTAPASLKVRDLWAHADVATITPPFSWTSTVASNGFAAAYRLSPV